MVIHRVGSTNETLLRMKKYIYMTVVAIAALCSCSIDNDPITGETEKQALTFTATIEGAYGTRATYNSAEKCASWEEGDQIIINGKAYNAQSAGLTTTFKAATAGQEAEGSNYNAYFACTYDGTTATLPAEVNETWVDGEFNMPMYASSTDCNLRFKNLCGVLKISVSLGEISHVKSIKVSSSNCATSGAFTISSDAAVLVNPSAVSNTVTVTYTDPITIRGGTATNFYIPIPAQTYRDLKIEISNSCGTKSMTTASGRDITVERNKIYPINFVDNAPISGTAKATIGDKELDVPWVQLTEYGPKWAVYNLGVTDGSIESPGELYKWGAIPYSRPPIDYNNGNEQLRGDTDTATYIWGSNWRMPTCAEFEDLIDDLILSEVKFIKDNHVRGIKINGRGKYSGNSLFLPEFMLHEAGDYYGVYWTSTPCENLEAWSFHFLVETRGINLYPLGRQKVAGIRPVLAK